MIAPLARPLGIGCLALTTAALAQPGAVTFSRDVAPIVFEHCAACHRPGASAPFSLLTYEDVSKRARQIAMVTQSRYMPPWLPDPDVASFADERRLSDGQIALIRRWAEAGAPEGDRADLPPAPTWTEGWQLGEPDLVVRAPEAFTVPADGVDVFRNLVIPVPVNTTRYVRAVELRPGNPAVVHHAIIQVDRTASCARLDAAEPGPGFGGMSMGKSEPPDGAFLGWTPGKVPTAGADDTAWRLEPGMTLVLQLHLLPSGKPEEIRPTIGLFFADGPPPVRPFVVTLRNDLLDIPAGAPDYRVTDRFTLPVAAEVVLVYPHAHYLGKDLKGYAILPDGARRWLIHIPDWDVSWQDDYQCEPPIALPAGSELHLEYTYDNSADNVRNPNDPPQPVRYGNRSSDEMATLTLQLLTADDDDRRALAAAFDRKAQESLIARASDRIARDSTDAHAYEVLGTAYRSLGRTEEAIAAYEQSLVLRPDLVDALVNLGSLYGELGQHDRAVEPFRRVLEIEPSNASAHTNLGLALEATGNAAEAVRHHGRAVELDPDHAGARYNLGTALARLGRHRDAAPHLRRTVALQPDHANAHVNLGLVLVARGQLASAVPVFETAIELEPDRAVTYLHHGQTLMKLGRDEDALASLQEAVRLAPDDASAHAVLALALRRLQRLDEAAQEFRRVADLEPTLTAPLRELAGTLLALQRFDEAIPVLRRIIELEPRDTASRVRLGVALGMQDQRDEGLAVLEEAVRMDPRSADAHTKLALLLDVSGRHEEALEYHQRALRINPNDIVSLRRTAWMFATSADPGRRGPGRAVERAERAAELTKFGNAGVLDTLAAAYAAAGRFEQAGRVANRAANIAAGTGNEALAEEIRARVELYRRSEAYVEPRVEPADG